MDRIFGRGSPMINGIMINGRSIKSKVERLYKRMGVHPIPKIIACLRDIFPAGLLKIGSSRLEVFSKHTVS
jgi:hypothetical protein